MQMSPLQRVRSSCLLAVWNCSSMYSRSVYVDDAQVRTKSYVADVFLQNCGSHIIIVHVRV